MDPAKYTLIKASAGSGKTYQVTKTIASRIEGGLHPSQILATTFTRKAAAELTVRIRERLVDQDLLEEAAAMPAALVGTVNSVTGQLLGEFAFEAGLSPRLTILTEHTGPAAFDAATSGVIATAENANRELLSRTEYDRRRSHGRSGPKTRVNLADTVHRVVQYARTNNITAAELEQSKQASLSSLHALFDESASLDLRGKALEQVKQTSATLQEQLTADDIATNSIPGVERWIAAAANFHARVTRDGKDSAPWSEWFGAEKAKLQNTGTPAPVTKVFTPPDSVATSGRFRDDLKELIAVVFDTARGCLDEYATYKKSQGLVDFTDQEQLVLHLLKDDAVRNVIRSRFRLLAVDEFQDTSPLQLAVFTELAALVEEVVWVGDVKQSIYGFRDADPELMHAVAGRIEDEGGATESLRYSWRTHEIPLRLSNGIFSGMFPGEVDGRGRNREVWLEVPPVLKGEREGGHTELWEVTEERPTIESWASRIARGVELLKAENNGNDGSYAVLTRNNAHADRIQEQLEARGIPCSRVGTPLNSTREGKLLRAALRWLLDEEDTKALIEIITFVSEHRAHEDWLTILAGLPDREARSTTLSDWGEHEALVELRELRHVLPGLTVTELVARVVDALDLRARSAAWGRADAGAAAISGAMQGAAEYNAEPGAAPPSVSGLVAHLDDPDRAFTVPVRGPQSVFVGSIHQAKGLEWNTVIAALPDAHNVLTPAGVWVHSDSEISLDDPLAGREIYFWPETLLGGQELEEQALNDPIHQRRMAAELEEEQRLLYVALTRASYRTVIAPKTHVSAITALQDIDIETSPEYHSLAITDRAGTRTIRVASRKIEPQDSRPEGEAGAVVAEQTPGWVWADRSEPRLTHPIPASFAASELGAQGPGAQTVRVGLLARLGSSFANKGERVAGGGDTSIGECVHAYLATPYPDLEPSRRRALAEQLVTRWGVAQGLAADRLLTIGDRFTEWVRGQYPGANLRTEVPFIAYTSAHQRTQGWIDLIVSTEEGHVIIDHKTYAGSNPEGEIRRRYAAQLDVYRQALGAKLPARTLIHFPMRGEIYEVVFPSRSPEAAGLEIIHER